MAPPPPPALPEELIEGILLRLPPDEPACLFRAALVCKPWCRLISGPGFRRRYRKLHRTAPMLGFLCGSGIYPRYRCEFVPTSAMPTSALCPPLTDLVYWSAIDAHHGRVLLHNSLQDSMRRAFVVWDPISDVRREVPMHTRVEHILYWNAAVLCAADCHAGPFLIVFLGSHRTDMFISTYSSHTGTWSSTSTFPNIRHSIGSTPCAHVGNNALYFLSRSSEAVIKYDLCLHQVSVIALPHTPGHSYQPAVLTSTEGRGLRWVTVYGFKLYLWSRKDGPQVDDGWTQNRVIDLEKQFRRNSISISTQLVGFADGIGVVFFCAKDTLFKFDLKTEKLKKVSKGKVIDNVLPYMSFYTPALRAACRGEGPSTIGSGA